MTGPTGRGLCHLPPGTSAVGLTWLDPGEPSRPVLQPRRARSAHQGSRTIHHRGAGGGWPAVFGDAGARRNDPWEPVHRSRTPCAWPLPIRPRCAGWRPDERHDRCRIAVGDPGHTAPVSGASGRDVVAGTLSWWIVMPAWSCSPRPPRRSFPSTASVTQSEPGRRSIEHVRCCPSAGVVSRCTRVAALVGRSTMGIYDPADSAGTD